jgi:hypothetical protein
VFFRIVLFIWEFVLDVAAVSQLTENEKDLEILLFRQQLRIVERKQERGPQIPRWQKVPLAVVAMRLKQKARHSREALEDSIRLFKPATVIGWHREAVRRKWTYQQKRQPDVRPLMRTGAVDSPRSTGQPRAGVRQTERGAAQTGLASEPHHDSPGASPTWHSTCSRTITAGKFLACVSHSL